jgi:hypothetical protein
VDPNVDPGHRGDLHLEVEVRDATGALAAGARVWLDGEPVTTADGWVRFAGLVAGHHRLHARRGDESADLSVNVSALPGPVVITMARGITVRFAIRDDDGPLAGARILRDDEVAAISDAAGRAELHGVGTGYQAFEVEADGHVPTLASTSLELDPGGTADQTVTLPRGVALGGVVRAPDGTAATGATVTIDGDRGYATATCDDAGAWRFAAVAAGTYEVHGEAITHGPSVPLTVEVSAAPRLDVVITLEDGGHVAATVVDRTGRPVSEPTLTIVVAAEAGGRTIPFAFEQRGDGNGRITLRGLEPGMYEGFVHAGHLASPWRSIDVPDKATVALGFVVAPSAITGMVVDPSGAPIEGAEVAMSGAFVRSDVTRRDGRFDLGGVPPGPHELRVTGPGQHAACRPASSLVTAGVEAMTLSLPRLATITGRVILDGAPPPGCAVLLTAHPAFHWMGHPMRVRTSDGRFTVTGVVPGTWGLVIGAPGAVRHTITDLVVAEAATLDLGEIALRHGHRVTGRVRDAAGNPVVGARVHVDRAAADEQPWKDWLSGAQHARSDADGAFRFDDIDVQHAGPARPSIGASHPAHGRAHSVELPDADVDLELVLATTGAIEGALRGFDGGRAFAGATSATDMAFVEVDRAGRFRLDDLPAGDYRVRVDGFGGERIAEDVVVTVIPGAVASVTMAFGGR